MSATAANPGTVPEPTPAPPSRGRRALALLGLVAMGLLGVVVLAGTFFDLQVMTRQAFDAHALLQIADRAHVLGEPYYVAGADLKGPLWIAGHDLALRLTNPTMVWFAIGALVMAVAAATAFFVFRIAESAGDARWPAAGICVALFVWITTSGEEYAHTLYSRNWIALLNTATVAALAALPRLSGRRRAAVALLGGVTAGVALQTNISSAPTTIVLGLVALWLVVRGPVRGQWRLFGLFVAGGAAGLGSAFAYYAIRGGLHDFAWYWWSFSREYAAKTDRTGFGIIEKGWDDFVVYYRARPILPLVVAIFAADLWRRHRARESVWLDVTLLAWWLSECLVVAISQRFFPHYLILPLLPIAAMGAVMAARWGSRLPRAAQLAAPVALGFCALWFGNWPQFRAGVDQAFRFDSPGQVALATDKVTITPENQEARANIRRFAPPRAYALVWTIFPKDYTDLDLRSATRYVPRVWLTGEVPGLTTPDLTTVPEAVRRRFWADLRQTPPEILAFSPTDPEFGPKAPLGRFAACGYTVRWQSPTWNVLQRVRPIDRCVPAKYRGAPS